MNVQNLLNSSPYVGLVTIWLVYEVIVVIIFKSVYDMNLPVYIIQVGVN